MINVHFAQYLFIVYSQLDLILNMSSPVADESITASYIMISSECSRGINDTTGRVKAVPTADPHLHCCCHENSWSSTPAV